MKNTPVIKHCLICDVCIENFDHHCSWLNNCIGRRNIYLFWIFLILITFNIVFNIAIVFECMIIQYIFINIFFNNFGYYNLASFSGSDAHNSLFFFESLSMNYGLRIVASLVVIVICLIFIIPIV